MAPSARIVVALATVLGLSAAGPVRADTRLSRGRIGEERVHMPDAPIAPIVPAESARAATRGDSTIPTLPRPTSFVRVRLSLGAAHATVLDPLASPLRYGGAGPAAVTTVTHDSRGGDVVELSLEAAFPRLTSALSSEKNGPQESSVFTAARALWLHRYGGHSGGVGASRGLLLGVEGRFDGSLRDHRYREPALHFFYGLALASVGPAARWRAGRIARGDLSLEAAAPLLGMAYRPYCDLAFTRTGVRPRLAAPPSLTSLDAGATWALPLNRRGARALVEWRLAYLRYRDHDVYRSARQRLGLALELPGRP